MSNWKFFTAVFFTMIFAPVAVAWFGLQTWTPGLYYTYPRIFITSFIIFAIVLYVSKKYLYKENVNE